jgi:hypothetical protein
MIKNWRLDLNPEIPEAYQFAVATPLLLIKVDCKAICSGLYGGIVLGERNKLGISRSTVRTDIVLREPLLCI